jgi:hypothetical protein
LSGSRSIRNCDLPDFSSRNALTGLCYTPISYFKAHFCWLKADSNLRPSRLLKSGRTNRAVLHPDILFQGTFLFGSRPIRTCDLPDFTSRDALTGLCYTPRVLFLKELCKEKHCFFIFQTFFRKILSLNYNALKVGKFTSQLYCCTSVHSVLDF